MSVMIMAERPDTPSAVQLITELETHLAAIYPEESRHGYSVDKLLAEKVAFFVLRYDGKLAGCGGLQFFKTAYAEIKRMYIRPDYRGYGFGKLIVDYLSDYAKERQVPCIRLETGIYQREAIGLYEGMGFKPIPPFGAYQADPLSLFYEKTLNHE